MSGYKYIQDGSTALLGETCEIMNNAGIDYLIVGGWSPFLLNSSPLPHPGTKDVDILFKSGTKTGDLESLIKIFLSKGFIVSAKHPFQLLKCMKIDGFELMFNIDLLHPDDQEKKPEMFVDHIDFPVKESSTMRIDYKGKTIVLPKSDFFFDDFITKETKTFDLYDGRREIIEFNLLNEAGLILSKSKSVFNEKRTRDAYDIFLAIYQSRDYNRTISQLKNLSTTQTEIFSALEAMHTTRGLDTIDNHAYEWFSKVEVDEADRDTRPIMSRFFKDLNIPIRTA